jgi:hypothetical protein
MTTIYLTRHAYSCANYNSDLKKNIKAHRRKDPSLTMWGVYSSLQLSEKEPFNITKLDIGIYVSCLIRTWQTAVLLYNKCNQINLIVSPFSKEEDSVSGMNEDNRPNKIENQCVYFLYFLNIIRQHIKCKKISIYIAGEGKIDFILEDEWKLITQINTLYDYSSKSIKYNKAKLKTIRTCVDYLPQKIKPGQFSEYKQHLDDNIKNCLTKDGVHSIKSLIAKPYFSYHPNYLESNSDKFVAWLVSQPAINNEYRCVLHSRIMRDYLKNHFGIDKASNPCSQQNMWTLKLNISVNHYIEDGTLYEGIPKPSTKLLTHENEIICNQGLGGKNKTRKNKKKMNINKYSFT